MYLICPLAILKRNGYVLHSARVFFFSLAFQAHINIHRIDDVVINRDFVVWAFNFIELEISWNKGLLKKFFFCACEKHSKLTLGV